MATFATSHNIGVLDGADKFSDKLMDLSNIVAFIDALRHDVVAARLGTLLETQPVLLTKDGDVILAKDLRKRGSILWSFTLRTSSYVHTDRTVGHLSLNGASRDHV